MSGLSECLVRCKDFRLTRIETLLLQVTLDNDDDNDDSVLKNIG